MDLLSNAHSGFHVQLDTDLFIVEPPATTFICNMQPQHLSTLPPSPRPLSPYPSTGEYITDVFHDQHQVSYTRHCRSYRNAYGPRFPPAPAPPPPSPIVVRAHIYAPSRSTRTRITISGRPRIRDVVRQLLGHAPESRCMVSIKKRGIWQDVSLEFSIGDAEQEVDIRIVTEHEERRRRWVARDGRGEHVVMERWN
ncbi:hypothetical protein BU23DRAFT_173238 [Bimuria novae-zelandiae CBS 107.79]|uniref:Uncharacterized protein n=1 Tax=Bimuria novae-zelandiae CBS 107.79 TaxID=1447943 RepID=A0A6A5V6B4_9PLEO|nr:hypothetical protein BU23DRAFT_173238 [Bimuria novae-zelandiae CBS 107.79]